MKFIITCTCKSFFGKLFSENYFDQNSVKFKSKTQFYGSNFLWQIWDLFEIREDLVTAVFEKIDAILKKIEVESSVI